MPSNNALLVKMWPGGTLHVVVGTLKISLDQLKQQQQQQQQKQQKQDVLIVECCHVSSCE